MLHRLRLLDDDKLPFRKHRVTPGRRNNRSGINISPIAYSLVEIPFALIKGVLNDSVTYKIYIIRFIPHKKIDRLEDALTDIRHYPAALRIYF